MCYILLGGAYFAAWILGFLCLSVIAEFNPGPGQQVLRPL